MRKKWVVCMIACLTILLTGCNGNTAKETARNDTDKRISSTAGNTETEKADDTTSVVPETEQPVSSEATTEPSQQEKSDVSSTAGSKTETAKSYESVQVTKKPDSTQEQKQPQQSKPETPKVTEEVKPTKPKPTEEPKQSFDVNPYVSYARSYYDFVNADTEDDFDAYIAKCKELAIYDTGVNAEYGDKLITLSTCEYSHNNGRMVVVAKKVAE